MSFYLKDPHSRVDYAIDWSPYLAEQSIAASLWTVEPDEEGGIAIAEASFEPARSAARLAGGLIGHSYTVSNRATFSDGTSDVRSITLRVEAR
jgi:hypothetical protein